MAELLSNRRVIVCLGPGGVGKTTCSAAIAYAEAATGKKVCVVTIDPARRLASALGLSQLGNDASLVTKVGSGELYATMLDAHATFDDMVRRYGKSQEQIEQILANKLYQNLTTSLSGTQEFMAMERLFELYEDARFDVIVVDTPPSVSALDFLDAPKRLSSFLDNRIFKLLIKPPPAYLRPLSLATRTLLKTISKVVGAEVVEDAVRFFEVFSGIEDGFKERADSVERVLSSPETALVLISSPSQGAILELDQLAQRLKKSKREFHALIVNRVTPDFAGPLELQNGAKNLVADNWVYLARKRASDLKVGSELKELLGDAKTLFVDEIAGEISDLAGVEAIAKDISLGEVG